MHLTSFTQVSERYDAVDLKTTAMSQVSVLIRVVCVWLSLWPVFLAGTLPDASGKLLLKLGTKYTQEERVLYISS